ncbi:MAG TPA: AAA family ATPase [Terriglobia bacterium]|nr:AAA family ATPase [Terriglobia bacterium]
MFLRYFGLSEQPFGMTPDPRYLYMSSSHREALASLIYGIETGRGFVSLIAEPGMGKTTLLFQFMEQFRDSARTVFLFQTQGSTREFLSNLIADLGLVPDDRDLSALQRQLNEVLIQEARLGRRFVLVIDEAQNLDDSVLESVRMLSNFETSRSKLMQIVLAGQPPLADKLARPELEQLMQRVSIICRLEPFTPKEVDQYVHHRLKTAGFKGRDVFTDEALSMIASRSEGIPRNINNICFHALSLAYAQGQKKIGRKIIEEVLGDLELDTLKRPRTEPRGTQWERTQSVPFLEGVDLNSDRWGETERVHLRRGRYSPSAAPGIAGGGRPRPRESYWPIWAVILLTMILAGEMFQTFVPAAERHHAVSQAIAKTVGTARAVALKYDLIKKDNSAAPAQPQTTVVSSDQKARDIPVPLNSSKSTPNPPATNANGDAASQEPVNQAAATAGAVDATPPPQPAPVSIQVKGAATDASSSPLEDPTASSQIPKGTIVVESNVPGGAITINGETNPEWRTPHMFDLPQGVYRISVSQEGYSTWYRVIRVTPGNKHWITADLHMPRGVIVIDTEPPGMQVFIDGKPYGPSEVEAALDAGLHQFKVVPPGGKRPLEGSFVLKPGDILTRKIRWPSSTGQPTAINKSDTEKPQENQRSSKGRERS